MTKNITHYFRSTFEVQEFRDVHLYTLEVDSLLRVNYESIELLFQTYAHRKDKRAADGKGLTLDFRNALEMLQESDVVLDDDQVTLAYCFSK